MYQSDQTKKKVKKPSLIGIQKIAYEKPSEEEWALKELEEKEIQRVLAENYRLSGNEESI